LLGRFPEAETLNSALGDGLQRVVNECLAELSVVEVGAGEGSAWFFAGGHEPVHGRGHEAPMLTPFTNQFKVNTVLI
jgi:hypothetical protein